MPTRSSDYRYDTGTDPNRVPPVWGCPILQQIGGSKEGIYIYIYIYIYTRIFGPRSARPRFFQDLICFYISVWPQEVNPIFKNDLGPRGAIFPKYEPVACHGDPIQVRTSRRKQKSVCTLKCQTQTVFLLLWWVLGGGIPVYKEAYRMPLSINQGVWGVYLLPEIQFHMISPLRSSLPWGWLSSGITCMAMFAAFPSTIMDSTTVGGRRRRPPTVVEAAEGRLHSGGC